MEVREARVRRFATRAGLVLAVVAGVLAGVGIGNLGGTAGAWAAGDEGGDAGGVAVSVNGVNIQGSSPRVPGCAVQVAVTGLDSGKLAFTPGGRVGSQPLW